MSWVPWVPGRGRSGADSRVIVVAVIAIVVVVAVLVAGRSERAAHRGGEGLATSSAGDSLVAGSVNTGGETIPKLIDLGADKCVPCKMMAPILEEMRETFEGRLDVVFIDVWKDPGVGRQYGVQVIPTQIFLDAEGNELFRHQGFLSREDILAKWGEFGYEFEE
jgi:thioredoxin 1